MNKLVPGYSRMANSAAKMLIFFLMHFGKMLDSLVMELGSLQSLIEMSEMVHTL